MWNSSKWITAWPSWQAGSNWCVFLLLELGKYQLFLCDSYVVPAWGPVRLGYHEHKDVPPQAMWKLYFIKIWVSVKFIQLSTKNLLVHTPRCKAETAQKKSLPPTLYPKILHPMVKDQTLKLSTAAYYRRRMAEVCLMMQSFIQPGAGSGIKVSQ